MCFTVVTNFLTAILKVFVSMEVCLVIKATIKNGEKQLSGMGIGTVSFTMYSKHSCSILTPLQNLI